MTNKIYANHIGDGTRKNYTNLKNIIYFLP